MKNIFFTFLCLLFVTCTWAQTGKVMVTNTETGNFVRIKWLEEGFYGTLPSNVYRKELGTTDWKLLTINPIVARPIPCLLYTSPSPRDS